jgi:hypothetical protein
MHWEGKDWGETPAAMLRIHDKPTASWELALQPGQDARLLSANEFFGFGVDTGMGCFLDVSGRDELPKLFDEQVEEDDWSSHIEVRDPKTSTNLIAYRSGMGDGSYPVWIGRDVDGEVTCFVADMLVLHHAEPLPPTVSSTAAFLEPFPAIADDRREASFTSPSATANFIAAQITDVVDFRAELDAKRR